MAQIFSRAADAYLRLGLILAATIVVGGLLLAGGFVRSDDVSGVGLALEQPVPFSHRHHAGELGIDCRYCHGQVETAATAGYPPTHTCMTCHSQLWTNAAVLAPVRHRASPRPARCAGTASTTCPTTSTSTTRFTSIAASAAPNAMAPSTQ